MAEPRPHIRRLRQRRAHRRNGRHRFLFGDNDYGQDRITDFRFAEGDRIDFSEHATVNGLANLTIASGAAGAVINYATTSGPSSIVLDGIVATAITQDWFVF